MSFSDSIFPSTSGIYLIRNTVSGKRYVGSAVNLQKRRYEHLRTLRAGQHKNPHLQASFNAHGEDAFETEVLELVLIPFLTAREQVHINAIRPEYNACPVAGSNLGMKISDAARARMSAAKKNNPEFIAMMVQRNKSKTGLPSNRTKKPISEETRRKMALAKLGKKQSPETIAKRMANAKGRKRSPDFVAKMKGHPVSEATRAKIGAANKAVWLRKHPPSESA